MSKGNGTTRNVGPATATRGRTFNTGGTIAGYNEVGRHVNAMRASLSQFAQQDGWRDTGIASIFKTISETGNIRTVSISVSEDNNGGRVKTYYETNVIENLTPAYEASDRDAFQGGLRYINGRQFDTISEASTTLNAWIKKLNKMKIR